MMFRNYLKIGWRNIRNNGSNAVIHITGLALGLMAFLFIQQYILFEKSYDSFHTTPERLYRVTTDQLVNGAIKVRDAMTYGKIGTIMEEELPEVINSTTTYKTEIVVFNQNNRPNQETGVIAADANFLQLFNYEVIAGDRATMLSQPNSIVLTASKAKKYFGEANPLGQSLKMSEDIEGDGKVTGIIKDIPENTHYSFDILVSTATIQESIDDDGWNGYNYYGYVLLEEGANITELNKKLPALSQKYLGDDTDLLFNLQAVLDIHLHSDFTYEPQVHGSAKAVGFLKIISIFILLIAWINYINLSTAKAIRRAKEVGVRKVVGAEQSQLMVQFFMEALIINVLGALLALGLSILLLPYFNTLVDKTVMDSIWNYPDFLRNLALFFGLGTIVTGIYPALVLSSFKPIAVLKGSFGRSKNGTWLRKSLVVLQFSASLILIAGTVIIYQQVQYMTSQDIGINTKQVIGFTNPDLGENGRVKYKAFLEEVRQISGIKQAAGINELPGGGSSEISSASGGIRVVGKTERMPGTFYVNSMDDALVSTVDMKIVAGRNFNHQIKADSSAVVINEALLKALGIADANTVINEKIQLGTNPAFNKYPIVGVVKDFNRTSLKEAVEPTLFFHDFTPGRTVIQLEADGIKSGLAGLEKLWGQFFPQVPFDFSFLDERFAKLYQQDRQFGFIFFNFALLAIFVASMGLFGLASFMAVQRTKEVGIRKVLGASVSSITFLFFKDFLWLIGIAVLISVPLIYWNMSDWLTSYAYRINFPWIVLVLAIGLMTLLAFFTVSFQTWKLALLNPSQTIQQE